MCSILFSSVVCVGYWCIFLMLFVFVYSSTLGDIVLSFLYNSVCLKVVAFCSIVELKVYFDHMPMVIDTGYLQCCLMLFVLDLSVLFLVVFLWVSFSSSYWWLCMSKSHNTVFCFSSILHCKFCYFNLEFLYILVLE